MVKLSGAIKYPLKLLDHPRVPSILDSICIFYMNESIVGSILTQVLFQIHHMVLDLGFPV